MKKKVHPQVDTHLVLIQNARSKRRKHIDFVSAKEVFYSINGEGLAIKKLLAAL